ncbi:MAG: acyltransferase family protein [Mycobacteriales bacterium]
MADATEALPRLRYRPELDGVRGIAILLVLSYHVRTTILTRPHPLPTGGYLAIDLFFPLSGMLITSLLVQEWQRRGAINLKTFYYRRIRRLLPTLTVVVAAHAVLTYIDGRNMHQELLGALLIFGDLANVAEAHKYLLAGIGSTWSLSVEEQFYLIWPVTLLVLLRCRVRLVWIRRLLLVVIAFLVVHVALHAIHGGYWWHLYHGSDLRFPEILLGCWVGTLPASTRWVGSRVRTAAAALLVLMIAVVSVQDRWLYEGGTVAFALLAAVVMAPTNGDPLVHRVLRWRPLVAIGEVSYSLYLWHELIDVAVWERTKTWAEFPRVLLAEALTALVATLCYFYVERRFRLTVPSKSLPGGRVEPVEPPTLAARPLPAASPAPPANAGAAPAVAPPLPARSRRILVVSDADEIPRLASPG